MKTYNQERAARLFELLRQEHARATPCCKKVDYERFITLLDCYLQLLCIELVNLRDAQILFQRTLCMTSDWSTCGCRQVLNTLLVCLKHHVRAKAHFVYGV